VIPGTKASYRKTKEKNMCGIVGYIGEKQAQDVLLYGLSRLEYRGYDSAGIAVREVAGLKGQKKAGRLSNLSQMLEATPLKGNLGIGHTRWATHGEPSDKNAHPHFSRLQWFIMVSLRIIGN
jgi:glucosamine--fructose-6-phosphate aminotransferase (isomerizing)